MWAADRPGNIIVGMTYSKNKKWDVKVAMKIANGSFEDSKFMMILRELGGNKNTEPCILKAVTAGDWSQFTCEFVGYDMLEIFGHEIIIQDPKDSKKLLYKGVLSFKPTQECIYTATDCIGSFLFGNGEAYVDRNDPDEMKVN
jgi:hypothetical protein